MRLSPIALAGLVFFIIVAVAAALAGGITWAIPVVLVGLILAVVLGVQARMASTELQRHHGDPNEAMRDSSEGGLPKTHVLGDDQTALGDTPEVHAEISPHDFPKGAPERQAAERMAAEESGGNPEGTTGGQADPSQREGRVREGETSQGG
jgi:hypothetical protein